MTQALPQKHGILFTQENSRANFMDIHRLEICAFNVHIFIASYFPHIVCFL